MSANGQYPLLDSKNLIGIFDEIYEPMLNNSWAMQIGTKVDSDMAIESYDWLGAAPGLEEVREDNAAEEQLTNFAYSLKNRDFAKFIKVKAKDLRRDKLGQIRLRVGDMAEKATEHWNVLSAQTVLLNPVGYDKVQLFSTSHPEAVGSGGALQNNDLTVTQIPALDVVNPLAPTAAEASAILNALIGQFYFFVDDKNYPINGQAKEFLVLVSTPSQWSAFTAAANLFIFAAGAQNPITALQVSNGIKVRVELVPMLNVPTASAGADNYWFNRIGIFRTDSRVKSLLLQEEVAIEPRVTNQQNEEYIKFSRYLFGIAASRNVGTIRWQSAIRATMS